MDSYPIGLGALSFADCDSRYHFGPHCLMGESSDLVPGGTLLARGRCVQSPWLDSITIAGSCHAAQVENDVSSLGRRSPCPGASKKSVSASRNVTVASPWPPRPPFSLGGSRFACSFMSCLFLDATQAHHLFSRFSFLSWLSDEFYHVAPASLRRASARWPRVCRKDKNLVHLLCLGPWLSVLTLRVRGYSSCVER